ncbi:MAG: hypothetical protein FWD53_02065 [Phycisphaerales bacterium]|nr:hypothetical protein [Phycisphaerales bacterium]
MLKFTCPHCGNPTIFNEFFRGKPVRCLHCGTLQTVPDDAVAVCENDPEKPTPAEITTAFRAVAKAAGPQISPNYSALEFFANLTIVAGAIQCLAALIFALFVSISMLLGIFSGIITIALGFGLLCLRDIAISVNHIRDRK